MTTSDPTGPEEQRALRSWVPLWWTQQFGVVAQFGDGYHVAWIGPLISELPADAVELVPVSPSPATTEAEKLRRQVEAHKAAARDWYLRYEEAQQRFLDLAGSLGADAAVPAAAPVPAEESDARVLTLVTLPGRMGGAVTIGHSRLPLRSVLSYVVDGASTATVMEAYPSVTADQVEMVRAVAAALGVAADPADDEEEGPDA